MGSVKSPTVSRNRRNEFPTQKWWLALGQGASTWEEISAYPWSQVLIKRSALLSDNKNVKQVTCECSSEMVLQFQLRSHCGNKQPNSMSNWMSEIWDGEPKEQCMGYVIDNLKGLKEFLGKVAQSNRALIVYLG